MTPEYEDILTAAVEAPFGIAIYTSDPGELRRLLYLERQELLAGPVHDLEFRQSPSEDGCLWVVPKAPTGPEPDKDPIDLEEIEV